MISGTLPEEAAAMDPSEAKKGLSLFLEPSEEEVLEAMKEMRGFLDITPEDFKEIYRLVYQKVQERICRKTNAKDLMTKEVVWVDMEAPLKEAAEVMSQSGVSGLPVLNKEGGVEGIISERDFFFFLFGRKEPAVHTMDLVRLLIDRMTGAFPDAAGKKVREIMSKPVWTLSPDTPLMEIYSLFSTKRINRAPVVGPNGQLIGIVSRGDLIKKGFSVPISC